MSDRPVWVVVTRNDDPQTPWLNEELRFTDEAEALTFAKGRSQNPATAVRVIEPSGEEWSL